MSRTTTPPVDAPPAAPGRTDDTRELILDAAHECLHRVGIRRTTVQEVARHTGLSRQSIYYHFPDKQALVAAVAHRSSERNLAECARLVGRRDTLADQVAEVAVWLRARSINQLFFGLDQTEPETLAVLLTSRSHEIVPMWITFWAPLVDAAAGRGEVRAGLHTDRAAEWIARMLLTWVLADALTFDADDPRQLRRFVRDHLVAGLR